jgi:hypothetical protein
MAGKIDRTCNFCTPGDQVPPVMFGNHGNICVRCVGTYMKLTKIYDVALFEQMVEAARRFEVPKSEPEDGVDA